MSNIPADINDPPRPKVSWSIFFIAIFFAAFQLYTATFNAIPSEVVRTIHVGFLLLLIFFMIPYHGKTQDGSQTSIFSKALGIVAFMVGLYHWIYHEHLVVNSGNLSDLDFVVGILTILLVFEAARRVMGWALPLICLTFFLFVAFGEYLPGELQQRPRDWEGIINQFSFGTEGIYSTPVYISSTYIFLFILFGSFLEQAGMLQLFNDIALGTVGHTRGGPAKVSVISSALMGTINGSGVANVVTTGQFTIPLMKRFGYPAAFAGGVEATASMGGQIMPPVMGAVAFIMAETLELPYSNIVIAALIPAFLYFFTVFWMVHLVAGRRKLNGLTKEECPSAFKALKDNWYLLLPLIALVYLLFGGRTPMLAGTIGLGLTLLIIFGGALSQPIRSFVVRCLFWLILAAVAVYIVNLEGKEPYIFLIGAALFVCMLVFGYGLKFRISQITIKQSIYALVNGALHAVPVGIACALVGVIIGTFGFTGLGSTFGNYVIGIGQSNLFLSLVLTMVTCLILGMGIPTIPNYIITSTVAAPILADLGVNLLVAHMFVFYFGIMADLTPPVALAAMAASPIAKESPLKISCNALLCAAAGFIVPYIAVYSPELMLQGNADLYQTIYTFLRAFFAVILWGIAIVGFLLFTIGIVERVIYFLAAILLVMHTSIPIASLSGIRYDHLGMVIGLAFVIKHLVQARTRPPETISSGNVSTSTV